MSDSITVDASRLPLLLQELRLPAIAALWQQFTERADREGWPSARLLAALAGLELGERAQRRIRRHLIEAHLPPGKTLDSSDFASFCQAGPMLSRAHVTALASGDAWLAKGANILLCGPSGSGKSHLGAALGHALIENGYRVLFTRTPDLVQRLQSARQTLSLESVIDKRDKYHLIVLDDLCYVRRDQAETSGLFELIAGPLRTAQPADHQQPAVRRVDQRVPRRRHDARGRRPPGPPRHDLRDERRELSPPCRRGATASRRRSSPRRRDDVRRDTALVAQRHPHHPLTALRPDNLRVAHRPSKLSRYSEPWIIAMSDVPCYLTTLDDSARWASSRCSPTSSRAGSAWNRASCAPRTAWPGCCWS